MTRRLQSCASHRDMLSRDNERPEPGGHVMTTAYLNRIATAVPPYDMHKAFIPFAESLLPEGTPRNLYRPMVRLAAIDHRYSFIKPIIADDGTVQDADALFVPGHFPSTAHRMEAFRQFAPQLARCALLKLALTATEREPE